MTFGLARRFGDRILIVADTMISNSSWPRSNIIPGELKAIVLSETLSVAYAGSVGEAMFAIKESAALCARGVTDVGTIIEPLKRTASETFDTDQQTEFLVASHLHGPEILKIWKAGEVVDDQPIQRIGHAAPVNAICEIEESRPIQFEHDWISKEEMRFMSVIMELACQPTRFADDAVGGFWTILLASPLGHTYQDVAGTTCWDTIESGRPASQQQLADRASGMTQYSYNLNGSFGRGVAILGAYMPEPRLGFLYHPLEETMVEIFPNTTARNIVERVGRFVAEKGAPIRN